MNDLRAVRRLCLALSWPTGQGERHAKGRNVTGTGGAKASDDRLASLLRSERRGDATRRRAADIRMNMRQLKRLSVYPVPIR